MKLILTTLASVLALNVSTFAGITGINPIPSAVGIRFDDSNSLFGILPGGIHTPGPLSPWTGALYATPFYTDGTTGDTAEGHISASTTAVSYSLNLPVATLSHVTGNAGFAQLKVSATVQVQVDALGFSSPVLFPTFFISGTVQTGGYAFFNGNISYTSAALGLVDNVTYGYQSNTPGAFTTSLAGIVSSGGATHNLPINDTLTLVANFTLQADPSTISVTTVPEPSAAVLALLSLPLLLRRRRA